MVPAYEPAETLPEVIRGFGKLFSHIIVVNDGSSQRCSKTFEEIRRLKNTTLLEQAVNLGKGSALKVAFNHFLLHDPLSCGVVTMDADGQHRPEDVKLITKAFADSPSVMHLGVRDFSKDPPWKSYLGNVITRRVFEFFTRFRLSDTQSGLRSIPRDLIHSLMTIRSYGYDFELEMLFQARKSGVLIAEIPIQTIYFDDNRRSSFNPVIDSTRIYSVFVRYTINALIIAVLDLFIFVVLFKTTGHIFLGFVIGRLTLGGLYYYFVKKSVFRSRVRNIREPMIYSVLTIISMLLAYGLTTIIVIFWGTNVMIAKLISESLLVTYNFSVQQNLIFSKK